MRTVVLALLLVAIAQAKVLQPGTTFDDLPESIQQNAVQFADGFAHGAFSFVSVNTTSCIGDVRTGVKEIYTLALTIKDIGFDMIKISTAVIAIMPTLLKEMKDIQNDCHDLEGDFDTVRAMLGYLLKPAEFLQQTVKYVINPFHWVTVLKDISSFTVNMLVKSDYYNGGFAAGDLFKHILKSKFV